MDKAIRTIKITKKVVRYTSKRRGEQLTSTSFSITLPKELLRKAGILNEEGELTTEILIAEVREIDGEPTIILKKP